MLSLIVIGENPLKCITKDEKGLVLIVFSSFMFWPWIKTNES